MSGRRLPHLAVIVATLCLSVAIVATPSTVRAAAPPGASAYVPVSPYRILDTREAIGFPRKVGAGEAFTLPVTGLPADATAVVLNLTATAPADAGFVTVYPTGVTRPTASSINVDARGQTIANLVTVPLGTGLAVDIFAQPSTDLLADVQGYYTPTTAAQAGRFIAVTPTRLLDTREPTSPRFSPIVAGETIDVDIAGLGVLPVDTVAAALKITVTDSTASGYWTVYPANADKPTASNLNVDGAGQTIANQVLARLANGHLKVFSQSGGQLVIDLVGSFTGPGAPSSDVGLFVPVTPARLLDSREAPLGALPGYNRTAEVTVANRFGVPATGVGAVVVNATITQSVGDGFFSLWPARTYRPFASSLNASHANQTIANHVITPVSTAGFSFYTQNGAHLVADITGWYTGAEQATVLPPHVPLTGPGGPPANAGFAFTQLVSGAPARWNPCAPIRYSVNLGGYPESNRRVIAEAVERLEAATGLVLIPVADTTFIPTRSNPFAVLPPDGALRRGAFEMVIALSDSAQTDLVSNQVVGLTEIAIGARNRQAIDVASVVIDAGDVGANPEWSSTGTGLVLLHELAHAVGLTHVPDATQVMNRFATSNGPTTYAAGDLSGLWQVGSSGGCIAP